ncbi:MAG: helix-turn-helix domain-containing protein [Shimia sp.]|jgi:transcriptional regulator with XRE-family HTH domain|uniref:helix-turn-helix domain-containing protein n=1 Tax=Shimia sp. TaxID=1954381 RepID=UPI004059E0BA
MTALTLDSDRLKTVRKARKIGRPKLAKLTGLTERQLAKLEGNGGTSVPEAAVTRLSEVLQIPVMALTGELALIDDDLKPAQSTCTSGCCH